MKPTGPQINPTKPREQYTRSLEVSCRRLLRAKTREQVQAAMAQMTGILERERVRLADRERRRYFDTGRPLTPGALRVLRHCAEHLHMDGEFSGPWLRAECGIKGNGGGARELRSLEAHGLLTVRLEKAPRRPPVLCYTLTEAGKHYIKEEL